MNLPLRMEANTKGSGKKLRNGVTAKWLGRMDLSIKDTGRITAKMG